MNSSQSHRETKNRMTVLKNKYHPDPLSIQGLVYLSGTGSTTHAFTFDVNDSLGMGWGYYLHGTVQSVTEGNRSWEGQEISISVYIHTYNGLLLSDGTIKTPLRMGFCKLHGDSIGGTVPQFRDRDGKY